MSIDDYMARYAERFEDGFPSYQLARTRTDEEIIKIIQNCLDTGKDVYEAGLITADDGTIY